MSTYTAEILWRVEDLLNIGIALSIEKDHNRLFEMILSEARKITRADAGTLYLVEDDYLVFKIMHNATLNIFQGGNGEPIDMPPVALSKESVAGYVAITKQSINIPDLSKALGFNFSGHKRYEEITGYRNVSMLVVPLENHQGQVIGVLQLINAKDEEGRFASFAPYYEKVISSLASQAAIAVSNMQFIANIEKLFHSFMEVMATAIDARSPYNANHTRRVAIMTERLIKEVNGLSEGPLAQVFFDKNHATQLVMAAWLHDIGKITTPSEIMDKPTRLADRLEVVLQRFDYLASLYELEYWKNVGKREDADTCVEETKNWMYEQVALIEQARELILLVNNPMTYVDQNLVNQIKTIAQLTYTDRHGNHLPWLTDQEVTALVVPKGTLTDEERTIMEEHVNWTKRMLEKIPFPHELQKVPEWAVLHHEFLDGSGYPRKLNQEQIPLEGRILTLIDIFDALIAADRPYKKALSVEEALTIMTDMVQNGRLDAEIYQIFCQQRVWESLTDDGDQLGFI